VVVAVAVAVAVAVVESAPTSPGGGRSLWSADVLPVASPAPAVCDELLPEFSSDSPVPFDAEPSTSWIVTALDWSSSFNILPPVPSALVLAAAAAALFVGASDVKAFYCHIQFSNRGRKCFSCKSCLLILHKARIFFY
jgi:hypothetical protein